MAEQPIARTPITRASMPRPPAARNPATPTPAAQSPTAQRPTAQPPTAQFPAAQNPAAQTSTAQPSAAQPPTAPSPAAETAVRKNAATWTPTNPALADPDPAPAHPARTNPTPAPRTAAVRTPAITPPAARLELQPVVHVTDMAASVAFYQRLGGEIVHGAPADDWVLLQVGAVQINLVAGEAAAGAVELNVAAAAPIEQLQRMLPGARIATHRIFGRHLLVRSPEGLLFRLNQREPDVTHQEPDAT